MPLPSRARARVDGLACKIFYILVTPVTVCGNGHPYSRGDDETVVSAFERLERIISMSNDCRISVLGDD